MKSNTPDRASIGTPVGGRPLVVRVLSPFQRFFSTSAAGGIVLLVTTAAALVWANSAWADSYHHFWDTPFTIGTPTVGLTLSLHTWVNDGLMAVFFFLVGLEIKRETLVGELATLRSAALPVAAALGGMVIPALLYASVNRGGAGAAGWGVPMATDIAFALGILALLGDRVPSSLRIFLAALAIADDLGAVLVIAVFYTESVNWAALSGAGATLAFLFALNRSGARQPRVYALVGVVMWGYMLASGIHATIAGVLLAFAVPARTRISEDEFLSDADASLAAFRAADAPGATVMSSRGHQEALHALEVATDHVQAPLQRMEHALNDVVAFVIMPIFALANAGIPLGSGVVGAFQSPVALGIALGLLLGKPLGISLASAIAVRLGVADLPSGVRWSHIAGVSVLAGIGFTMSLFIAGLAFRDPTMLDTAKLGALAASIVAGLGGYVILRSLRPAASSNAVVARRA